MISRTDICSVIAPSLVDEGNGSFVFSEKNNESYGLKEVIFDNAGHFLVLSPDFFKKSRDIYQKKFEGTHLKKDCDQVVLFEKEGKKYICWIEVKTSLGEIFRKGIFQIPGCYYKVKSMLGHFKSYNSDDLVEYALAVYANDAPKMTTQQLNDDYMRLKANKIAAIPMTSEQKIERKYTQTLQAHGKGILYGEDFGMHKLPVKKEYIIDRLPFIIWPVSYKGAVVNMDDIVSLL